MISFTLFTLVVSASIPLHGQTPRTGNIFTFVDSLSDVIPTTNGGDEYVAPTGTQLNSWGTIVGNLCDGNYSLASTNAGSIGYQLIQFTDNSSSPNKTYYILEKQASGTNYWGTFFYNPAPHRARLFIQSPHSRADVNTEKQGVKIFGTAQARAFYFAGAHRCNSSYDSPCGGTNASCGANKLSDQAHNVDATLQRATEIVNTRFPGIIVIQNHGYTKDSTDVEMSNGTTSAPSGPDYLLPIRDSLQVIDNSLVLRVSYIPPGVALTATNTVEGRYINGSSNPCNTSVSTANGRFIHIEQALPKLRDTDANRQKLADAVARAILEDRLTITIPNGGEVWPSGSSQTIVWSSAGTIENVKIESSKDNGATWNLITASTPNDGSYTWTIPGVGSKQMRIRITDALNPVIGDTSAGVFEIDVTVWPITGTATPDPIASTFGPRLLSGVYDFHYGLDLPNVLNTPIHPVKPGVVVRFEDTAQTIGTARERYGNWILVRHDSVGGQPVHTAYLHLRAFHGYQVGDTVTTDDTIAFMGKSGVGINTIHVHLQYFKNLSGTSVLNDRTWNPLLILPYTNSNSYMLSFLKSADSSGVQIEVPETELDFDGVVLYGSLATRTIRFSTRTGIDPANNDNPRYNNVFIDPDQFTIDSTVLRMQFWVKDSEIGALDSVRLYDIQGYSRSTSNSIGTRYAVASGDWTGSIWALTSGGAAGSATPPTAFTDIVVSTAVTVTVNTSTAECKSISFGSATAKLAMGSGSILSVYGDFAPYSTTHSAFSSWANGAKFRFAGTATQTISGYGDFNAATTSSFKELQINKIGGQVQTPGAASGNGMSISIVDTLEIINGTLYLSSRDDIQGRSLTGSTATTPAIIIRQGGIFSMAGSASHIRSGNVSASKTPIGNMTVYGTAILATSSTNGINFSGIDVENGGHLVLESFSASAPNNFKPGTITVNAGADIANNSIVNFWNNTGSAIVNLQSGATYIVGDSVTFLPPVFNNSGLVRYDWNAQGGTQVIADTNYASLAIANNGSKLWTLSANRSISDSLWMMGNATLTLTSSSPRVLTVNTAMKLDSGSIVTNTNTLVLGTSTSNVGRLSKDAGRIKGTFKRWIASSLASSIEFPLAQSMNNRTAVLSFTTAPATGGTLTSSFTAGDPGLSGLPLDDGGTTIVNLGTAGYWTLTSADGLSGGTYSLDLTAQGFSGVVSAAGLRILKRSTGGAWTLDGIHAAGTGTPSTPVAHRTAMSGFSEYGIGGAADNPLQIEIIETENEVGLAPRELRLEQNFPNPFNPSTHIRFTVPNNEYTKVTVFNTLGQVVRVLWNGQAQVGRYYDVVFDAVGLSTSMYLVRLEQNNKSVIQKIVFMK